MARRTRLRALLAATLLATAQSANAEYLDFCPWSSDRLEYLALDPITGAASFHNLDDGRKYDCELIFDSPSYSYDCSLDPQVGNVRRIKSRGLYRGNGTCSPGLNIPFNVGIDFGCTYQCRIAALAVSVDIRPRSPKNPFNARSSGVTSVAIMSQPGFDAATVDPQTILLHTSALEGSAPRSAGQSGKPLCREADVGSPGGGRDGLADLICNVETGEISPDRRNGAVHLAAETFDGTMVMGEDSVWPVPDDGAEYYCPEGFDPIEYTSIDHTTGAATFLNVEIDRSYSCRLTRDDDDNDFNCITDPQDGDLNRVLYLGFSMPYDGTCSSFTDDVFGMTLDNLCAYRCDIIR